MHEKTCVILKPDAVSRNLIGKIIQKIEDKGLKISYMELIILPKTYFEKHYIEHINKSFFTDIVTYMSDREIVYLVVEGIDAIRHMRKIAGSTNPLDAERGSIRGDYATSKSQNIIHTSDSIESAKREIDLYFNIANNYRLKH